jgi:hypothetical protein
VPATLDRLNTSLDELAVRLDQLLTGLEALGESVESLHKSIGPLGRIAQRLPGGRRGRGNGEAGDEPLPPPD